MKNSNRSYLLVILLLYFAIGCPKTMAQAPNWDWIKSSVGTQTVLDDLAVDQLGNSYITGTFSSESFSFGEIVLTNTGMNDAYIAKYDSSGEVVWAKSIGGARDERIQGIATDAEGNIYITGHFDDPVLTIDAISVNNFSDDIRIDAFVAKLDSSGTPIWVKTIGSDWFEVGIDIAVDTQGNVYCTGVFSSTELTIGDSTLQNTTEFHLQDVYIAKFDNMGNALWAKSAGGSNVDIAVALATDQASAVYLTGYYSSASMSFGNTTITLAGDAELYDDGFFAKYDASGALVYAKSFGGMHTDEARGVAVDAAGNAYVCGVTFSETLTSDDFILNNSGPQGTADGFLIKYDSTGNLQWSRNEGDADNTYFTRVALDNIGKPIVVGSTDAASLAIPGIPTLSGFGNFDPLLIKYDTNGDAIWGKIAGGNNYDVGHRVQVDSSDRLFLYGYGYSTVLDFDSQLIPLSGVNCFLAKLDVGLAIKSFDNMAAQIAPNPATDFIGINFLKQNAGYNIVNADGKIVLSGTLSQDRIDIRGLHTGVYFIKLDDGPVLKFIKK